VLAVAVNDDRVPVPIDIGVSQATIAEFVPTSEADGALGAQGAAL
jgi:hypothetical protein